MHTPASNPSTHNKNQRGASLVEYALLVALIAVVCIAAVTLLGDSAEEKFDAENGLALMSNA